ncbi:hypothetical protein RYX36_018644 [Vicia faba]
MEAFEVVNEGIGEQIEFIWRKIREPVIVPMLRVAVLLCLGMSVMMLVDKVYMGISICLVKLFGRKPEKRYKWESFEDDLELENSNYPMVLVQIPMYNEGEVYQLSIGAACGLSWPSNRLIIQILDDSTDPTIKELVQVECNIWGSKGVKIKYEVRDNRNGYKAGALKEGMKHSYVTQCDYVVIFDADFQPQPDFLRRTIPFLVSNPEIGLVQARWKFVNADECLMTRMQQMSLDYHFKVEQEVINELPSTLKAFRYQQHRWSCGPANLFRKTAMEILASKNVSLWKKIYILYSFFFVRKIVAHINTFVFYCIVLPATVLVPEVVVPKWGSVYIPFVITLLKSVGTPRSFHLVSFWILFENTMSLHRTKATIIGLLEASRVNEWVVTEKLGATLKVKGGAKVSKNIRLNIGDRIGMSELCVGLYLLFCGSYDVMYGKNQFFIFLYIQAIAFFILAFGYVGTIVPNY